MTKPSEHAEEDRAQAEVPEADDAAAAHTDGMVTRVQAAALAKVSISTIRRWESSILPPVVGEDGVHRFREEQVREIVERRVETSPPSTDAYDGATAATVFELFDQGLDGADVVKRTKLHPHAVQAIEAQWAAMRGRFVVDAKTACELSALPWLATGMLLRSGADLLKAVRRAGPRPCVECGTVAASICATCARAIQAEELARRATREQREKDERLERQERFEMEKVLRNGILKVKP